VAAVDDVMAAGLSLVDGEMTVRDFGRVCAHAVRGQRDLREYADRFEALFPAGPFDPALLIAVSLANACSAPGCGYRVLRVANRAALWAFAVDRLIDDVAQTRTEVTALVRQCLAAVRRGEAAGPAGQALLDLLALLRTAPGYPQLHRLWRRELGRMLRAMAREWDWRHGEVPVGELLPAYLDNADNLGFCFVFACHLVATARPGRMTRASALLSAARAGQLVLRLVNDLGSAARDRRSGDLTVLRLGLSPGQVYQLIGALDTEFRRLSAPLRADHAELIGYVERQLEFNLGFHPVTEYWPG
jgi:Terpene synthase family 2, C-terminal metal binding